MILFSTNLESKAQDIVTNYRSRFQIEFLIRDSKQYTGLQTCEARSINKLHFHHNMSLFATSLAKATIRKQQGNHEEIVLSVGDIQTEINNELLVNLYENEIYIRPIFVNWNFCCIFGLKYKSFNYVVCLKHTSKRDIS
ncbi:MAG: hypothetical protein KBF75_05760 [Saprospiraceae bacterium]|nr:hypothetical protein [Saprospiraceae bacterium]